MSPVPVFERWCIQRVFVTFECEDSSDGIRAMRQVNLTNTIEIPVLRAQILRTHYQSKHMNASTNL